MENNLKDQHYKNMGITLQMDTLAFEAESVAYVVCQHYGIDTAEYSFPYVAGWSSDKEVPELKASLDTIRRAAADLIVKIDEKVIIINPSLIYFIWSNPNRFILPCVIHFRI